MGFKCSHWACGRNILRMWLGKFQMIANCYGGSNVSHMLILHSKCCINVPTGSRSYTWTGNIWNVPNLLLAGKWWVPSTSAYNILKMFLLVSRPPCPQWVLCGTNVTNSCSECAGTQHRSAALGQPSPLTSLRRIIKLLFKANSICMTFISPSCKSWTIKGSQR